MVLFLDTMSSALETVFKYPEPSHPPGGWLEPYYTMKVPTGSYLGLYLSVQSMLKSLGIDFVYVKIAKYKLKCVTYLEGRRVVFAVQIFRTGEPNELAIEFQRRRGDIVDFSKIYSDAKRLLSCAWKVKDSTLHSDIVELPELDVVVTDEEVEDDVRCFLEMGNSGSEQTQLLGVRKLGYVMAGQIETTSELWDDVLELFFTSLLLENEDIHRCAAAGIANFAETNQVGVRSLLEKLGKERQVKERLYELTSSSCLEVVRQSARALGNMEVLPTKL